MSPVPEIVGKISASDVSCQVCPCPGLDNPGTGMGGGGRVGG